VLNPAILIRVAADSWPNFTAATRATISPTMTDMAGMVFGQIKQFTAFPSATSHGDSSLQHIVVKVCWVPAGAIDPPAIFSFIGRN